MSPRFLGYRSILYAACLAGFAKPHVTQTRAADPVAVSVGAYVNDIQALDLHEHSYAIDLYIWFRWRDDALNPAATLEFVNPNELWGHIEEPQYEDPVQLPPGESYQVIRVQGRFSHKFFLDNFPYDRQELLVEFEDSVHEINRLTYEADDEPLALNPRLRLPGFRLATPRLEVEAFGYPTAFGDSRRTEPNV